MRAFLAGMIGCMVCVATVYADDASKQMQMLNSQIQAQLQQMQEQQQKQLQQLNAKLQTQIKDVQTTLQEQIQTMHKQVQDQVKELAAQIKIPTSPAKESAPKTESSKEKSKK